MHSKVSRILSKNLFIFNNYFLTEQFGIGALSVTHQRMIAITLRYVMFVILKYLIQYFRFSSNNSSVHL